MGYRFTASGARRRVSDFEIVRVREGGFGCGAVAKSGLTSPNQDGYTKGVYLEPISKVEIVDSQASPLSSNPSLKPPDFRLLHLAHLSRFDRPRAGIV